MNPSPLARLALALLWVYRRFLSPVLATIGGPGSGCRFHPTCSCYAADAVRTHGAIYGSGLALRRLLRCGPWSAGGNDPVPTARPRCVRAHS